MTQKRILELAYSTALNEWVKEQEMFKESPEECQDRLKKAQYELKTIEKLLKAEEIDILGDTETLQEFADRVKAHYPHTISICNTVDKELAKMLAEGGNNNVNNG